MSERKNHVYTNEEREFFTEYVLRHHYIEIQTEFIFRFGWQITMEQVKRYIANHKLNTGFSGCFPPGHTPSCACPKGKRISPATEFKEGSTPHNKDPIGTEKILSDGYTWVKINDIPKSPKKVNWKQKHKIIWEDAYGLVPPGHCLLFADGDRTNIDLDNLILVSRNELARMNQNGLIHPDKNLTKSGLLVAKVINKTAERQRGTK